VIAFAGIAKAFAGAPALSDVTLALGPGLVHGLLGENGAGKSTLMRILFGLERADAGTVSIAGKTVVIRSPRDARALGLGMVHQHLALVPTLDVVDNLALILQAGLGRVPRRQLAARLLADAAALGWQVDPTARVGDLAVGQ
jgi:simple sugar transport system ATP-binding protein